MVIRERAGVGRLRRGLRWVAEDGGRMVQLDENKGRIDLAG